MITFVTSSPFIKGTELMNPQNRFVEELRFNLRSKHVHALFVCADPDHPSFTDACAASMRRGLEATGIQFDAFHVLDGRNPQDTKQFVDNSELIVLSGGHVPTQHRFLAQVHLREHVKHFRGVVIGISAGSMNMADKVYSPPELPGETTDPYYTCEFQGLGLTRRNILPHWQELQYTILDRKRMLEDIIYPPSWTHAFFALPDGSYIFSNGEREELRGEAYLISNGQQRYLCSTGDVMVL